MAKDSDGMWNHPDQSQTGQKSISQMRRESARQTKESIREFIKSTWQPCEIVRDSTYGLQKRTLGPLYLISAQCKSMSRSNGLPRAHAQIMIWYHAVKVNISPKYWTHRSDTSHTNAVVPAPFPLLHHARWPRFTPSTHRGRLRVRRGDILFKGFWKRFCGP